jgi:hypothetical protein
MIVTYFKVLFWHLYIEVGKKQGKYLSVGGLISG